MTALAANGSEIAKFLAGANPNNWTADALLSALEMHAGEHRQQIDALMGNAPASTQQKLWTDMQQHMAQISDVLADGIAKQFPDKAN